MNQATFRVLHVGCGQQRLGDLPPPFNTAAWQEVRLDIDPSVEPDIVASMTEMGVVETASFEALWSSHNLEHLYPHDVPRALAEFVRVLTPTGFAVITLPDLQSIARLVAEDHLLDVAYVAPAGGISAIDMLFGFRPALARGNYHMAHRTGFTATTLEQGLLEAGFASVAIRRGNDWNLWAVASMSGEDETAASYMADTLVANCGKGLLTS